MSRARALFDRQPIARKLAWLVGGTTALALSLMAVAVMGHEWFNYPRAKRAELAVTADIVGANSKGALLFGDRARATETLNAFRAIRSVTAAAIYDKTGTWFAGYGRDGPTRGGPAGFPRDARTIEVERPIVVDGEKVGAIWVISEWTEIYARLERYLLLMASILSVILVVVLVLTLRLQRLISEPLLELAAAARAISNHDYSVRAIKYADDEIGVLTDAFNRMVDEVAARTESLLATNAELALARQKADAAASVKAQFLANMSHEIRTPMNGILGMTELALETPLNNEQREYLATAHSSAESLLTLLDSILDLSKIEAGRLDLEHTDFDLDQTLDDVHRLLALKAHQKGLELAWDVDPRIPGRMSGDPTRLRQVLINLIGNAIKFTSAGEIVTTAAPHPDDGGVVEFSVRDSGIGISETQRERIFDPFIQADDSTTRNYGGSGLGLAICRRLTELMGGTIWVESVPGQGSTFRFTARMAAAQSPVPASQNPGPEAMPGAEILVVDGNAINRHILRAQLQRIGLTVTVAGSADEALEIIALRGGADAFPVIFADVHMPGVDGFQFVDKLRGAGPVRSSVIGMVTSVDTAASTARCREVGITTFLTKPVSKRALWGAVSGVLTPGAAPPSVVLQTPAVRGRAVHGLSVLVAEDNLVNQKVIQTLLTKAEHTVTLVGNGAAALEEVRARSFDLIFMDVQMPVMDGLAATAAIRRHEQENGLKHTPIIALTAHALAEDAQRCLSAGMDQYLAKPLRNQKLWEAIEKAIPQG